MRVLSRIFGGLLVAVTVLFAGMSVSFADEMPDNPYDCQAAGWVWDEDSSQCCWFVGTVDGKGEQTICVNSNTWNLDTDNCPHPPYSDNEQVGYLDPSGELQCCPQDSTLNLETHQCECDLGLYLNTESGQCEQMKLSVSKFCGYWKEIKPGYFFNYLMGHLTGGLINYHSAYTCDDLIGGIQGGSSLLESDPDNCRCSCADSALTFNPGAAIDCYEHNGTGASCDNICVDLNDEQTSCPPGQQSYYIDNKWECCIFYDPEKGTCIQTDSEWVTYIKSLGEDFKNGGGYIGPDGLPQPCPDIQGVYVDANTGRCVCSPSGGGGWFDTTTGRCTHYVGLHLRKFIGSNPTGYDYMSVHYTNTLTSTMGSAPSSHDGYYDSNNHRLFNASGDWIFSSLYPSQMNTPFSTITDYIATDPGSGYVTAWRYILLTLKRNHSISDSSQQITRHRVTALGANSFSPAIVEPTRTGYTFDGWWTNAGGNPNGNTTTSDLQYVTADATYYAQWAPNISGAITLSASKYHASSSDSGTNITLTTNVSPTTVYSKYDVNLYTGAGATGNVVSTITIPAASGYTFGGFYTGKAGTGTKVIDENGNVLAAAKTQIATSGGTATWYALWLQTSIPTVTVTLNTNGSTGGSCTASVTCSPGASCTLPSWNSGTCNIYNGKKIFKGWATTNNATSGTTTITGPSTNTIYYAVWKTPTCSVTNGSGTIQNTTNNKPKCQVTCNTGYHTSSTYYGDVGATSYSYTCSANTYYVQFHNNCPGTPGGSMSNQTMTYGSSTALTNNGFTCTGGTGYNFSGWATSEANSNAGTVAYQNHASVSNLTTTNSGTVHLYAVWSPVGRTVTLNKNGGDGTCAGADGTANATMSCSGTCTLPVWNEYAGNVICEMTKGSKVFVGWSTTAPTSANNYLDNANTNVVTGSITPSSNVTYYAVWRTPTCTTTNATSYSLSNTEHNRPACLAQCNLGYGSHYDNTYTGTIFWGSEGELTVDANCSGIGAKTYYNKNGGGGTNHGGYDYWTYGSTGVVRPYNYSGHAFTAPTGGTFANWKCRAGTATDSGDTYHGTNGAECGTFNAGNAPVSAVNNALLTAAASTSSSSGALTLFACWQFNITYNLNNGTNPSGAPTTYNNCDGATLPTPTRDGYSFAGWYDNSSFSGSPITSISAGSTGTKTYYANWTSGNYLLTLTDTHVSSNSRSLFEVYGSGWKSNSNGSPGNNITTVPYPTRSGYTFRGYYTSDQSDVDSNVSSTTGFKMKTTLTDINGCTGTNCSTTIAQDTEWFAAWAQNCSMTGNGTCTLTIGDNGQVTYSASCDNANGYTLSGNGTANPVCTPKTYTVTLNKNNGTGGTSSVIATYDADMPTTNVTMPTRTGYTFVGYYDTSASTGGKQYYTAKGTSARVWDKTTANPVLYARWAPNMYTVTLSKNTTDTGATDGTSPVVAFYGQAMPTSNPNLLDTAIVTDKGCVASTGVYPYSDGGSGTFYNVFFRVQPSTTYTYTATTAGTRRGIYEFDSIIDPSTYTTSNKITPTRVYKEGGSSGLTTDTFTTSSTTQMVMLYLGNNGVAPTGLSIFPTDIPVRANLTAPTRTNYNLTGYYDATSNGTKYYNYTGGSLTSARTWNKTSDTTLYAQWSQNSVTVNLNTNNNGGSGSCDASVTCDAGASCPLPQWSNSTCNITNGSKIFVGWATTNDATTGTFNITAPSSGTATYYAVWVTPTCSVTNGSGAIQNTTNNEPKCQATCDTGYHTSGTYYGNAGETTVSYECTPNTYTVNYTLNDGITVPSGYKRLEYLESRGQQYINTGFVPTEDYEHKIVFEVVNSTNSNKYICGSGTSGGRGGNLRVNANTLNGLYIGGGSSAVNLISTQTLSSGKQVMLMDLHNNATNRVVLNGNAIGNSNQDTIHSGGQLTLFASAGGSIPTGVRIYSSVITQNGVVKHNFVPARRESDGAIGMYDLADTNTNTAFHNNAGSSTFAYAEFTSSSTETYNTEFTVPAPTHPHGTFAGWDISGMDTTTHYHGTTSANTSFSTETLNDTMSTKFKNLRATSGNVNFTANWTCDTGYSGANCAPAIYTITVNLNGGHQNGNSTTQYIFKEQYGVKWQDDFGGTTTLPVAVRDNYTFAGYYDAATGGNLLWESNGTLPTDPTLFTANTTIYAHWTPNTYTITVSAGNGVSTVSGVDWTNTGTASMSKTYDYGATIDLDTVITPTNKTGYYGNTYSSSGSGSLSNGSFTVGAGNATITVNAEGITAPTAENVTLASNITTGTFGYSTPTLTGTVENASTDYDSGISLYYKLGYVNVSSTTATCPSSGYDYTDTTAGTDNAITLASDEFLAYRCYKMQVYATDGALTSTTTDSSNAVNLSLIQRRIKFNGNNGTVNNSTYKYGYARYGTGSLKAGYISATDLNPYTAVRDGYTFDGWWTATTGGSQVYDANLNLTSETISGYTSGGNLVLTANKNLYAHWILNTCDPGYYMSDGVCTACGAGYYCTGGTTRTACPTNLTTPDNNIVAYHDEAGDCGRKLHLGSDVLWLRSDKKVATTNANQNLASVALNFDFFASNGTPVNDGGQPDGVPDLFLNLSRYPSPMSSTKNFKMNINGTVYYGCDDGTCATE